MKLYYYLSSILNVIKLKKKLKQVPSGWVGPFRDEKDAREYRRLEENGKVQKNKKFYP